jgi:hypothetical protein
VCHHNDEDFETFPGHQEAWGPGEKKKTTKPCSARQSLETNKTRLKQSAPGTKLTANTSLSAKLQPKHPFNSFHPESGPVAVKEDQGERSEPGSGTRKVEDNAERRAVQDFGSARPGPGCKVAPFDSPGLKERLEYGRGSRGAGGVGSGVEQAANENAAPRRAGKGGKGQRAEEGEKGKLRMGERRRRSGAGPRKSRKAGSRENAELGQVGPGRGGEEPRRPGPGSRRRETTRKETNGPRGSCLRPGGAQRLRRGTGGPSPSRQGSYLLAAGALR